jgi:hypothetical protein
VLQIVTKIYFREGAPLNSTLHRAVLYTNRNFLRADVVGLPVGELAPSSAIESVSTVTLSITEHLEATNPDGTSFGLIATSGTNLIDDLADVLSFGLNSVFSKDGDLVRRLVPASLEASRPESASGLFRETFQPARYIPTEEIDAFRPFMAELLALERRHFEAAMRAIRRIVRATQRAAADPTLAYVDLVASLESLSEGTEVPDLEWDHLDYRKRSLIEEALEGADPTLTEKVQDAVIEAERLGAKRRFVAFVTENVSAAFFRAEAIGAVRPIRGPDLERALKLAYDVRSRNVHVLAELPPEAWALGDSSDTVSPPGLGTMLSLEGLARLARHVVRSYVARAPDGVDPNFDWRASLPGILQMRTAPQYWVWMADGFDRDSAERYLSGFLDLVVQVLAGQADGLPDMSAVLERIEGLLPKSAGEKKEGLVAIYVLWHRLIDPSGRRPQAERLLTENEALLETPGIAAFAVGLLTDQLPDWSVGEWQALALARLSERGQRRHRELPPTLDAALWIKAAEHLAAAGRWEEARSAASHAVEEVPGNEMLLDWEEAIMGGEEPEIDLHRLVLGTPGGEEEGGEDSGPGQDADDEAGGQEDPGAR